MKLDNTINSRYILVTIVYANLTIFAIYKKDEKIAPTSKQTTTTVVVNLT